MVIRLARPFQRISGDFHLLYKNLRSSFHAIQVISVDSIALYPARPTPVAGSTKDAGLF